jgi:hypothetical protein
LSSTRPEHLAASGASREDVSAVLDELASVAKRVELETGNPPVEGDEPPLGFVPKKAREKEGKRKAVSPK